MPISNAELSQLRQAGLSDDQILGGLSQTDPDDVPDISSLQKHGLNSTQILDGFAKYESLNQPQGSWLDTATNFVKAPLYGAQQELSRAAATEKDALGATGVANAEQTAAQGVGDAIGPYDPAAGHFDITDPDTWSYAPRAVAESLPATGGYLGAAALGARVGAFGGPEGAVAGGVIGPMLFGLNRYLGEDAETRAANDGRSDVTTSDVMQALPGATTQAALDTAGNRILANNALLKASPVKGAGWSAAGQTAGNVAKVAAANAATGAGSSAAGQLGTSVGTDKGAQLDPQQVENAAGLSGVTAGVAKSLGAIPEIATSARLANGDSVAKARLAALINGPRVAGNPDNPFDNARIMASTQTLLNNNLQNATSQLKASIQDAQSQGVDASGLQDALRTARDMKVSLDTGYPLDPGQTAMVRQHPAMPQAVADSIGNLSEFNRLSQMIDNTPQAIPNALSVLRTMIHAKHTAAMLGLGAGAVMHSTPIGLGIAGVPLALRLANRGWNAATTSSNPVADFIARFGGLETPPPATQTVAQGDTPAPIIGAPQVQLSQVAPNAPLASSRPAATYGPEGSRAIRVSPVRPLEAATAPSGVGSGQPQAKDTEPPVSLLMTPRVASGVNDQADMIEGTLKSAQETLNDPNASVEAKEAAKQAKIRAVARAFALHEAIKKGGTKALPQGARVDAARLASHDHNRGAAGRHELFEIHTPSGTRLQAVGDVRKSREAIAAGVLKRDMARREILEGAKALPLSPTGKALLGLRLPNLMGALFHNAENQVEAAGKLREALGGFNPGDREMLKTHFENARAANGIGLFGTWKHKGTLKRGEVRIGD